MAPSGSWRSIYDGATTRRASSFDSDHVAALGDAWDSGACASKRARPQANANDPGSAGSLRAAFAASNRAERDTGSAEWPPGRTTIGVSAYQTLMMGQHASEQVGRLLGLG